MRLHEACTTVPATPPSRVRPCSAVSVLRSQPFLCPFLSPFCWALTALAVINLFHLPFFFWCMFIISLILPLVTGSVWVVVWGRHQAKIRLVSHQSGVGVGRVTSYLPEASSPRETRHVASCRPTSQLALLQDGYRSLNKIVWNKAGASSRELSLRCLEAALIRFTRELWNLLEVREWRAFNSWDA